MIALADFSTRITETMKGSGLTPFVLYDNNWLLVHPAIVEWSPAPALLAGVTAFMRGNDVSFLASIDSLSKEKISLFWQAKDVLTLGAEGSKTTRISRYVENSEREFFV